VFSSASGTRNLGFPRLLQTFGPAVDLHVKVVCYDLQGKATWPAKQAHAIETGGRPGGPRVEEWHDGKTLWLSVKEAAHPFLLGLAMTFSSRVQRVEFTVERPFGETLQTTWSEEGG